FNKLIRDKTYTRSIELLKTNCEEDNCSLSDQILDRLCLDILPQIHKTVEQLILESHSIERILFAGNYPRLCKLTLINLTQELAMPIFANGSHFAKIFKNQIMHLVVFIDESESRSYVDLRMNVFERIFALFTNLRDLDFGQTSKWLHPVLKLNSLSSNSCFSSTIVNLHINVFTFDDCQCLLDGRLSQLRTFIVSIVLICNSKLSIHNANILHLKCFSLISYNRTNEYDSQIVPLLRRMIYLEQLTLYLTVHNRSTFIDGSHLKNEILDHMIQLQTFNFTIITRTNVNIFVNNQLYEDIRCTFLNEKFHQVDFYLDQYPDGMARSYIYSLPYNMNVMRDISRNFPGGLFTNVRVISLTDVFYPFEHCFYKRITCSFPFLTNLTVSDMNRRNYKPSHESNKNNQMSSVIVFPYLTHLEIICGNIDSAEQFLVDTKTLLPRLIDLTIPYSYIQQVTENFTREATRHNCPNIKCLTFDERSLV
ncbi:unnamed protein product, partial [Rotaria sp. Silwood2]